jgi:Acyl-coenzyme A synthetases/AMP-(fatty) acid ligases
MQQRARHELPIRETIADYLRAYDTPDANAAYLLVDRHDPQAVAFTVVDEDLRPADLSYGELAEQSRRFANVLRSQGVMPGDRVATLAGKSRDLLVALVGVWRAGAVHVPLFTAFATPAIETRLAGSGADVVIVDPSQRAKLDPIPRLRVFETGTAFRQLLDAASPDFDAVSVGGDGLLVEIFTSGTTGDPKGVPVPVRALAAFHSYLAFGLDVREDDVFWNVADPGWAYGLYYGILAPLAAGRRNLLVQGRFDPARALEVIRRLGVTNFAAAPTVYRSLAPLESRGLPLRRASSAGEPLTADILQWSRHALGFEVRDHYGQTELGMLIVNGWHPAVEHEIVHGSMGRPLPGYTAAVLDGEVAIDVHSSPLFWFDGYVNAPKRTKERFTPDRRWYITGDIAQENPDGLFFFASRADDIILMAGYRIGPFEVESVLLSHPAVAEAAVVGRPDERMGESLVAYIVPADGVDGTPQLTAELQQHVKTGFAAHAYPRAVRYVEELPKTPSGKIQRHLLRQREADRHEAGS